MGGEVVRASDRDRERVIAAVREHHAAGRITLEELTVRRPRSRRAPTWPPLPGTPLVRVYAFGLFSRMRVWRVPRAWAKRTWRQVIRGIRQGEHLELEP